VFTRGHGRGDADLIFNTRNDAGHFWNLDHKISGKLHGGQLGFDRQLGSFVVGLVGDYSKSKIDGARANPQDGTNFIGIGGPVNGPPVRFETEIDAIATLRARAGVLLHEQFLLYAHGGYAVANFEIRGSGGPANSFNNQSDWKEGVVMGAGAEFALRDWLSLFFEYSYYKFDEADLYLIQNSSGNYTGGVNNQGRDLTFLKAGINFRLSPHRAQPLESLK
jgi:opacity protein-like surface antigen